MVTARLLARASARELPPRIVHLAQSPNASHGASPYKHVQAAFSFADPADSHGQCLNGTACAPVMLRESAVGAVLSMRPSPKRPSGRYPGSAAAYTALWAPSLQGIGQLSICKRRRHRRCSRGTLYSCPSSKRCPLRILTDCARRSNPPLPILPQLRVPFPLDLPRDVIEQYRCVAYHPS